LLFEEERMAIAEYAQYDAMGLAELVARGDVKPSELTEEAIARIEKHNPALNAVIYKMYDVARQRARELDRPAAAAAPFRGVPFLLKDIMGDHEGVPTTGGSRYMSGKPAAVDSTLTARYKKAGLVILGKTNAPEFGILPTTEPRAYGATSNPWNLDHSSGGSSGGAAAAVAAGIVPAAHANDGGGSIRIPASCCGLFGLKPTRGRNPLGPVIGDALGGLICEHVVSRTVRDSAAILDSTHGPEPGDPYYAPPVQRPFLQEIGAPPGALRIAFSTQGPKGAALHAESTAAVEAAAALCAELGHHVEETRPSIDADMLTGAFMTIWAGGLAFQIEAFAMIHGAAPRESDFEPLTWSLYQAGKQVSAAQYQIAVAMLQMVTREIGRFHEKYDVWLTPTLGAPPLKKGVIDTSQTDAMTAFAPIIDYVPYTAVANATGQPSMSVPLHWSAAGLPVGVLFSGRFGDEAGLFRLAAQLEQARPWIGRKPPVWD
jgi:amidase